MNFNFGLIINPGGGFGGAQRRFTNLFKYLYDKYPQNTYYIVSYDLLERIKIIYPDYPFQNVIPLGKKVFTGGNEKEKNNTKANSDINNLNNNLVLLRKILRGIKNYITEFTHYSAIERNKIKSKTNHHPDFIKQVYRFIKNYRIQKGYYKEIEKIRKEKNITCFLGIYSGIIPLYFYLMKNKRDVGIIFCDMDSWFMDVLPKGRKYWYRKFSSFNYALENSDYIDFLSPFILEGVKKRGMKIKEESVSITPCSFTDYSKCKIGNKSLFQVAFAGRLEKDKNPDVFLDAAIKLSNKYPQILFHIMGEGRLSSDIKDKVDRSGCTNIIFHGFHPRPTEILADTSVFVSIQTTNNYPSQSVLEAMACGNAIIATDVGDTRMFINENNGILIHLDVLELVNSVETLYLKKQLREQLMINAYEYVRENHTIEKMADYYIALFNKASFNYLTKKLL